MNRSAAPASGGPSRGSVPGRVVDPAGPWCGRVMSGEAGGRWRRRVLLAVLAALVPTGGSGLAAQDGPEPVELRARTMARMYDNFFRNGDDAPNASVLAWATDGRVTLRIDRSPGIEIFGGAEYVHYERLSGGTEFTRVERLGESYGLDAGLHLGRWPNVLRLRVNYLKDRPVFDVGDEVRRANILVTSGGYRHRIAEDWDVTVDGTLVSVTFDDSTVNESLLSTVGGSVRYRGLGRQLRPELGGELGWRGTDDENERYRRGRVYARLVSYPTRDLLMSVRFRFRARAYADAELAGSNFGRSDEGAQWTLTSRYRATPNVHLDFRYDQLDMTSTLQQRNFTARVLTLGLTLLVEP